MGMRRRRGVKGVYDVEPPPFRDYLLQPYTSASIWNTPIGNAADEQPADLNNVTTSAGKVSVDPVHLGMDPAAEIHPLTNGNTKDHETLPDPPLANRFPVGATVRIADSVTHNSGWNGIMGLLNSADITTAYTGQPMNRPTSADDPECYGAVDLLPTGIRGLDDLKGDGRRGAHGGGRCGGIGGTLRSWEYDAAVAGNEQAIYHRLAINVYGVTCLSKNPPPVPGSTPSGAGWRWPAYKADSNFNVSGMNNTYGRNDGTHDGMVMGSLLALPLGYDLSGISDPLVQALGWTLLNFGAHIVDVVGLTARSAVSVENPSKAAWDARNTTTFHGALATLLSDLVLIHDCSPTTPGGAGSPRVAPPLPIAP